MASVLEPYIDEILICISEGETLRQIGNKYNVSQTTVANLLSLHPARATEAYRLSAQTKADEAYRVLQNDQIPIDRGRELASHLRWEAKMRDRAKYGDKVEVEDKSPKFTPENFEQLLNIAKSNAAIPGSGE